MIYLLLFPYCLTTILLYLSFTVFKANHLTLILSFILGCSVPWIIFGSSYRKSLSTIRSALFNFSLWPPWLLILLFTAAIAWVLSPLITYPVINQTKFVMFTSALDYYKHLYTITAITQHGLPPLHPYFPPGHLSYYYGYYLIPAALSLLLPVTQTTILFFYVIFTTLLSFSLLFWLYRQHLSSWKLLFFGFLLLIFSGGWDIIPTKLGPPGFMHYIELWAHDSQMGLAVNNLYTAFLWVPQHILAAVITLVIINLLITSKKPHLLILSALYTIVILSSIFVSLTLLFWSAIIFLARPQTRKPLLLACLVTTPLIIPFLFHLGPRTNVLSFYHLRGFEFINPSTFLFKSINLILSLLSEYGPLIFILPFILFFRRRRFSLKFLLFALAVYFPIVITWFVRSPRANDFAMRFVHPSQLILPLVIVLVWQKLKSKSWKIIFISLIIINLAGSLPGLLYEYSYRWKDRLIFDPYTSELLLKIRQLPPETRLASFGRDDWIFNIPPLGFKPILNDSLFDAGVYLVGSPNKTYESDGLNIFTLPHSAPDLEKLVAQRNSRFKQLPQVLSQYPYDYLILNDKIWVKQGQNPWTSIFKTMNVDHRQLTSQFSLWEANSLTNQTQKYQISIDNSDYQKITLQEHHFDLSTGLWFLASCGPDNTRLRLEFADYYTLYDYNVRAVTGCVGQLFYLPPTAHTPLETSQESLVDTIYAYPVVIKTLPHDVSPPN